MIRLIYLLRRQPSMDRAAFQAYWRNEHGPLVAGLAGRLNVQRYVQVHTVDDPLNEAMAQARGGMEPVYDGVAELWFESREVLAATLADAEAQVAAQQLVEDEARFIDLAHSPLWLAYDHPQVNPSPEGLVARERGALVKLHFPLRARADLGDEAAQRYWYRQHGPLIRRQAEGSGVLRYLQVHRALDEPLEAALREARGTQVDAYLGHAELWFHRATLARGTPEARAAGSRAIEDEGRFIDFARSSLWFAKEHVLVDRL